MTAPRRLVTRAIGAGIRAAIVAAAIGFARDQLLRRNFERYGPRPLGGT